MAKEAYMRRFRPPWVATVATIWTLPLAIAYAFAAKTSSCNAHRETTFAVIHPRAPFYSTLIRVNPKHLADPTDFVGDVALDVPEPTDDGTTYTFTLRPDVRFSDGQPLTAQDVVATYRKIIFPPAGVRSARIQKGRLA
jgi:ABC-type transport system substrate-binding protein